jgi:acyl-CoA dehydrogenase
MNEEHELFRDSARRYIQKNLAPHVDQWERDKGFPRSVYTEVAEAGLLGIGFPEEYGGMGGDIFHQLILCEELTRSGSPGLAASLGSLAIAGPPVVNAGTAAQKERWLPKILSGEWIAALGVTEPGAGSDVAGLKTSARRDDDGWVLNGQKTFITSGTRADFVTVVARTGGDGAGGVSLFGVETDRAGFSASAPMEKMGWHASDTAELFFDNVRVPEDALIGHENAGFLVLMQNFAGERIWLAASALTIAEMALEASLSYVRERAAFGRTLAGFQVIRHKLAEMKTRTTAARAHIYTVASTIDSGRPVIAEVAMAKNHATDVCSWVCDEAVQIHGGAGFMAGTLVERLYRDARLYPIGGGTREIMNEIIVKQGLDL